MDDLQNYNRKEYLQEVLAALKETHPEMLNDGKESPNDQIELNIVVNKNTLTPETWSKDVAKKLKEKYPELLDNHIKSYIKPSTSRIEVNEGIFDKSAANDDGTITLTNIVLDGSTKPIDKAKVAELVGLSEDDLTVNVFGSGDTLQIKVNRFPKFDEIPADIQDKITKTRDGNPLYKESMTEDIDTYYNNMESLIKAAKTNLSEIKYGGESNPSNINELMANIAPNPQLAENKTHTIV